MLPKYVKCVRSKGRDYYYFDTGKRVDGKRVYTPLPHLRSPEFGGSYAAMMGHRNRPGPKERLSVPALIDLYERSGAYRALSASSQKLYGIYLRRFEKLMPTAPAAEITAIDMQTLVDKMADTPGAANQFAAVTRTLFSWAAARGYVTSNPCEHIVRNAKGEHAPWPDHILAAALAADDGTVRLLTHLLFYTGQRIGDVLRMTWADIVDGRVKVRQAKTGKLLTIRLHSALATELARHPRATLTICATKAGRPMTDDWARKQLQAFAAKRGAQIVPHGLRKNAVIALLANQCSIAETAAITGQTLQMVEHYAKQRDQVALADSAVLRWEGNRT